MNAKYNIEEISFNKTYKFNQLIKNQVFESHQKDLEAVQALFAPAKGLSTYTDNPEKPAGDNAPKSPPLPQFDSLKE